MPFHGPDELAASVAMWLNTDVFQARDTIRKVKVAGVKVHAVILAFGDVDLIAWVSAPIRGDEHPTALIAKWVNAVRATGQVKSTKTAILVAESTKK